MVREVVIVKITLSMGRTLGMSRVSGPLRTGKWLRCTANGEVMDKVCGKDEESTAVVIELVTTWVVSRQRR